MLSLLASYASAIYLFLLNIFASFWLSRARTSTFENATELGFDAVNVADVVKVYDDVAPPQTLGSEKVCVLPSQEADITDHAAYTDEATSAIIRQAFLPSEFAEAMKRYGPVKVAGKDEPVDKSVKRCSLLSSDDNTSEDRFFSDGESITSSSMTSVGDESEPPDIAERFDNKRVQDRIEGDLTVADAHGDDSKSIDGIGHHLTYFEDEESAMDESGDEDFFSFSEESKAPESTREHIIDEIVTADDVRGERKVSSLEVVGGSAGDKTKVGDAQVPEVNDREGGSTPLSSILEKGSRSSCTLSGDHLSLDNRDNRGTHETDTFHSTTIHEEVLTEFRGVNEDAVAVSDGTEKNRSISSSPSFSSLEASEEVEPVVPRIVIHSPSSDDIHHPLTCSPLCPARHEQENLAEVLNFLQERYSEIPNRFLSSKFDDDESDEELIYDDDEDSDSDNDQYDAFSQAKIFTKPGSMPPGSLHLLRVSDDGTYITIEPFDSDNSEPRLSPFKSMRKVDMIKPAIPTVVVQCPSMEEISARSAQVEVVESTVAIVAQTSFMEEILTHTEPKSTQTIGASPSMKDAASSSRLTEAKVVGPIPTIVIQSPSMEDVNSPPSVPSMHTETKVVESTPAIGQYPFFGDYEVTHTPYQVGPSPSIEAIIALLDLPKGEVLESTPTAESTKELIEMLARPTGAELKVVGSTPTTVGPSSSIEAIIALLDLPSHGEIGVMESTSTIVSPSSSMDDIDDTLARAISTDLETVQPIVPAIIVQSPSMEEIFTLPARTLEEASLDIAHSPSMADLTTLLADSVNAEVEEIIDSTPSIAPEGTPIIALEGTPIRLARIEAEAIESTPTIVVQSPSMEQIPTRPPRPTRGFDEDITELLDFMNEHDCELPTFAPVDEDEEDDDSDSMKSHDLDSTSTESLNSLEDEDSDSMKNHDLTTADSVFGAESLRNLEDEWNPIFAIIDSNFGIPFAQGRAFLDSAMEWFENEQKSSWSEESLSQLSASSSEDGDTMDYYAGGGDDTDFDEDESTVKNVEDKDAVEVAENGSEVKMMQDENIIGELSTVSIPWTLFRPRVAPKDYLRVPERRCKRS